MPSDRGRPSRPSRTAHRSSRRSCRRIRPGAADGAAMKTSYGWRKVLAHGRAVGSPHSDPKGHACEDPTGALSAERQSGAGTEIRLQAALVRAVKMAPTTTPRCPAPQGEDVRFVPNSPVEGSRFELPVPREIALRSRSGLALHLGSLALRRRGPDWNGRPTAEAWVPHREEIPRPHPSVPTASLRSDVFGLSASLPSGSHTRGKARVRSSALALKQKGLRRRYERVLARPATFSTGPETKGIETLVRSQ